MGIFTNFLLDGFSNDQVKFYSPGQLFEVMSKLGEELKGEQMRMKVKTLLNGWNVPADTFRMQGQKVPAYALEIHAINEKNSPRNGYGTYIFVPDERLKMVTVPMTSIFSKPSELYDDEDPVKILSAIYANEFGMSTNKSLTTMELSLSKEDFYPINCWDKTFANDPLEEIFGIFDALTPGEFAGMSLIVIPPEKDWDLKARMRIRNIEDPEYQEEIGFIETIRRTWRDQDMPEKEAERLAGYKKQQLDFNEKAEIEAITKKINADVFRCTLRVYAATRTIAEELASVIIQKSSGKYNALEIVDDNSNLRDLAMRREGKKPFLLSSDEIASLWHVPAENTMGEKRHHPLPAALTPPDDLIAINIGEPGDIQKLIYSINAK